MCKTGMKRSSLQPQPYVPVKNGRQKTDYSGIETAIAAEEAAGIIEGTISKVCFVNFMNHSKFEHVFSAGVNILTGPNGAGKSSILQGIVLGLGAVAKATKRSSNISAFVKHGEKKAEIRVHLNNVGGESWRHEVYGDEIIFERIIYSKSDSGHGRGSIHTLRNSRNEQVYDGKLAIEEKQRILDHFNIELDNPTTILQQEEAKVFFTEHGSSTLYDFFERATLLKAIVQTFSQAQNDLQLAMEELETHESELKKAKSEMEKLEDKFRQSQELDELEKMSSTQPQMRWRMVRVKEEELAKTKKKMVELEKSLNNKFDDKEKLSKEIEALRAEIEKADLESKKIQEENRLCHARYKLLQKQQQTLEDSLKTKEGDLKTSQEQMDMKRHELRMVENAIREARMAKGQDERETEEQKKKLKAELKTLELESGFISNEIEELGKQRESCNESIEKIKKDRAKFQKQKLDKTNEKESAETSLKMLETNAQSSKLNRFDSKMEDLIKDIEGCKNFQKQPIGPIGRYIVLVGPAAKDKNLADLLEAELGKNFLKQFLVDNDSDLKVLQTFFKKHFPNRKPPIVNVVPFCGKKDDISAGKFQSSQEIPGLLDLLKIDQPDVFNFVVETKSIESTIVVEDAKAQQLFEDPVRVPKNVRKAITPKFYRYFPPNKTGGYSSYFIDRPRGQNCLVADQQAHMQRFREIIIASKEKIAKLDQEIKESIQNGVQAEKKKASAVTKIKEKQVELQDVRQNIQKIRHQFSTLDNDRGLTNLTNQKNELEKEIEKLGGRIGSDKKAIKELKEQLKSSSDEKEAVHEKWLQVFDRCNKDELEKLKENLKARQQEVTKQQKEIHTLQSQIFESQVEERSLVIACQKLRNEAMAASNNKELLVNEDDPTTFEQLKALEQARKQHIKSKRKEIAMSTKEAHGKFKKAEKKFLDLRKKVSECQKNKNRIDRMNETRKANFTKIRSTMSRNIKRTFALEMFKNGLNGKLEIDFGNKEMKILVGHKKPRLQVTQSGIDQGHSDLLELSSLSGGERSKTLVCLIISIWEHQYPPFRCLDEWDVYLDEQSRQVLEDILYKHATASGYQYIFISPQATSISGVNLIHIGPMKN